MCVQRFCKECRRQNPLRIQGQNLREGQRCIRIARLMVVELAEEQTEVEAYGNSNSFQVWEEGVKELGKEQQ